MSTPSRRFAFRQPIEPCLRDLDGLGHVNNAVYLTYLETTRNRYLFGLLGWKSVGDFRFILARTEIDFRSAAAMHDPLEVSLRPSRLGQSSFDFEYEVRHAGNGRLVAEARSVQVWFNYQSGRPEPLPEEVRRLLDGELRRTAPPA